MTEFDDYKAVECSTYELGENIVCNLRNCKRANSTLSKLTISESL